jgi:hypothetical protein
VDLCHQQARESNRSSFATMEDRGGSVIRHDICLHPIHQTIINCPGLSETQQINFIKKNDTPDLPSNDILILEGDPSVLIRNINIRSGLVKSRRCHAIQIKNRTVVFQFENDETRAFRRVPMEKTSNWMKFTRCQLPFPLIFAGTVHRSQGMTLQRVVIDYRTKF